MSERSHATRSYRSHRCRTQPRPPNPRRQRAVVAAAAVATFATVLLEARSARADEQLLIRDRAEHPHYFFDAEPHGLLGYGPFVRRFAPGIGFRGTFIIVQNGFIPTINNSVGIGVGADTFFPSKGSAAFSVPVVMQWNFWLSTHWAVFGEPGVVMAFGNRDYIGPTIYAGGRYHFNERIALTLRLGYPAIACGVSFYL